VNKNKTLHSANNPYRLAADFESLTSQLQTLNSAAMRWSLGLGPTKSRGIFCGTTDHLELRDLDMRILFGVFGAC
jgi:hypothetical protein